MQSGLFVFYFCLHFKSLACVFGWLKREVEVGFRKDQKHLIFLSSNWGSEEWDLFPAHIHRFFCKNRSLQMGVNKPAMISDHWPKKVLKSDQEWVSVLGSGGIKGKWSRVAALGWSLGHCLRFCHCDFPVCLLLMMNGWSYG